jgi:hypothetical protein
MQTLPTQRQSRQRESFAASKSFIEALCKILCHNICCLISAMYELGINPEFLQPAAA